MNKEYFRNAIFICTTKITKKLYTGFFRKSEKKSRQVNPKKTSYYKDEIK